MADPASGTRSLGFHAVRPLPRSTESQHTQDFVAQNIAGLQPRSSLLRAKRDIRPDYSSKQATSYRPHPGGAPTRASDLAAKRALRSVGKISTQLDPSHLTPWQLSRLREVRPDDPFTQRAVAHHAGLGGSASAPALALGGAASAGTVSAKPPPPFNAAKPKRARGDAVRSIPVTERLVDRLKEVDTVSQQMLSLMKRGDWHLNR